MFCWIKYSDKSPSEMSPLESIMQQVSSKLRERSISSSRKSINSTRESRQSESLTGTKNKVLLVNPDCYIQLLIEYICEETNIGANIKFDLCDENGVLMDIYRLKPQESASNLLKNRQTYVMVVYEKDESGVLQCIEPLIYQETKQDVEFYLKFIKNLTITFGKDSSSLKKGLKTSGTISTTKSKSSSKRRRSNTSQKSKKSVTSN